MWHRKEGKREKSAKTGMAQETQNKNRTKIEPLWGEDKRKRKKRETHTTKGESHKTEGEEWRIMAVYETIHRDLRVW